MFFCCCCFFWEKSCFGFLVETILISCDLKLCFFFFKFVENYSLKLPLELWKFIVEQYILERLFCNQFLVSTKERCSIVNWMISLVAISVVGPVSLSSCFYCCHSVQNVYAFSFNARITQKVVTWWKIQFMWLFLTN